MISIIERVAIIDLGSNSARLIVLHIYNSGAYNLVYHQKEAVRLSEGMEKSGLLQPEATTRAIGILKIFAHMIKIFKATKILAVATAAVRNAKNGEAFTAEARKQTGIPLRIISGEAEAKLGYLGVINTISLTDALLFDLGGGSTELTLIKNRKADKVVSLPFGAVTLTEKFGLQAKASEAQLAELNNYILSKMAALRWLKNLSVPLIGVGGTARNIAKMDQRRKNLPFSKVHNYRLGVISFDNLFKDIMNTSLAQRRKFPGLSSERADIIIPGLAVVKCLFDTVRSNRLIVSGCGVREGLFLQYYLSRLGQGDLIPDILEHSIHNILLLYQGNTVHPTHVAQLADQLFDGCRELMGLGERDKALLRVAALLHDIGIGINYYDHPRHSAYLVENARIFGLTHREQMLAAVVSGWHHGPSAKYFRNKTHMEFLDEFDWQTARKLALIAALAESLDTTQMGLVRRVTISVKDQAACLELTTGEAAHIEYQATAKLAKWFKKETGVKLIVKEDRDGVNT